MTAGRHTIAALAERLTRLSDGYRDDVAVVVEEARQAQVDPAALRRLVAWMRLDATQRAEREAVDDQYRFLAGEVSQPAELPIEGELANAVRLYGMHKSVREVAAELKVSVGKAHKLRMQAAAFTVHQSVNTVNTPNAPDAAFTVHSGVNTVNTPNTPDAAFTVHRDVNTPNAPDAAFTVHSGVNTVNTPAATPVPGENGAASRPVAPVVALAVEMPELPAFLRRLPNNDRRQF